MEALQLHQPQTQHKRRHSCLSEPAPADEVPSPKRPRGHESPTTARILNWLVLSGDPDEFLPRRTRSASPRLHRERVQTRYTQRAQSTTALDRLQPDFIQSTLEQQECSVPAMEPESISEFSYRTQLDQASDKTTSSVYKRIVQLPFYRESHCRPNNVIYREPFNALPSALNDSISRLYRERQSPQPEFANDEALVGIESGAESAVEVYYNRNIFTECAGVRRDDRLPMTASQVPSRPQVKENLSRPQPDALYGYPLDDRLISAGLTLFANNSPLAFPFLAIEYKGDGPTGPGSLWVATNQCLGAASTCVNIADKLNQRLLWGAPGVSQIDTHAFSVALNGSEARLFVSWKAADEVIYTQKFGHFLTQDPEHIQKFRRVCRNIIDWGRTERLQQIRDAIDALAAQSRLAHTEKAKTRPPPQSAQPQHAHKSHRTSVSALPPHLSQAPLQTPLSPGSQMMNSASNSSQPHLPNPIATLSTSFSQPTISSSPPPSTGNWVWSNSHQEYFYMNDKAEKVFQSGQILSE